MSQEGQRAPSMTGLILVPAAITLVVTLVRLVGEMKQWSSTLFNSQAGGFGALIGIVWLVPVFGIYFAVRLSRSGSIPPSLVRPFLFPVLGLLAYFLIGSLLAVLKLTFPFQYVLVGLVSIAAGVIGYRGWPELGKVLLAYGLAARIPVAVVMLLAMAGNWNTHYDAVPPGFPQVGFVSRFFWLAVLPQFTLWIAYTILVGMVFAAITLALVSRKSGVAESGGSIAD